MLALTAGLSLAPAPGQAQADPAVDTLSPRISTLLAAIRTDIATGILEADRAVIDGSLARATTTARELVAAAPTLAEGHFLLAAALGRRALRAGFREGLPLATETHRAASRALALDPRHAGAHDVLGKLHSEIRKLPWMVRTLAATITREPLIRQASFEAAERHLTTAIALDPSLSMAWGDLAQLYLRMGRPADARRVVEALERRPLATPIDRYVLDEARARLKAAR